MIKKKKKRKQCRKQTVAASGCLSSNPFPSEVLAHTYAVWCDTSDRNVHNKGTVRRSQTLT